MYPIASKENIFNLSSTFRKDSSLYVPYGTYYKLYKEIQLPNLTMLLKGKNKLVVWIVSHCNADSKRDSYMKELQKYIPIDIFGKCVKNIACPPKSNHKNKTCTNVDLEKYKFYISAENSICKDYVTGKEC